MKKNPQKKCCKPPLSSLDLSEENPEENNRWEKFFIQHGLPILYGIFGLIVFIIAISRVGIMNQTNHERDYINGEHYFSSLKGCDDLNNDPSFKALEEIIARHPELHAKYDGALAHLLLKSSQEEQARKYLALAQERTLLYRQEEPLTYYDNYTEASLLINDHQYTEALQHASKLHEDTINQDVASTLLAFNVLRIATLCQQLGDDELEQKTWEELKQKAGHKENFSSYHVLFSCLQEGSVSFDNYIQMRLKNL